MSGLIIGEVEVVNEVSLAPSAVLYDGAITADGDLTIKVNGFYYDLGGLHGKYLGSCGNALADNAVTYVYLQSGGTLGLSTVSYPGTVHIRLGRVVTSGGFIVRIILERPFFTAGAGASGANAKAGAAIPGAFSGNPKKANVVFGTAMPDANYSITFAPVTDGSRTFSPCVESKLATGFTIDLQANNLAGLVEVGWHAMPFGS
jgi:hypothetical protein